MRLSIVIYLENRKLITVNVLYFRPDYKHILNSFIWQTNDIVPDLPRVHIFLKYWKENIDAIISEVSIMEGNIIRNEWQKINFEKDLK